MKKIIITIGIVVLAATSIFAQNVYVSNEYNHPVPMSYGSITVGGTARAMVPYAAHITTKTTTTVTSTTCYVATIAICVTGAGTAQTLVIQDKTPTTPKILYSGTIAVGNTYIPLAPTLMTGGIDIVTGGTTAGTQDVFITYFQ
jgi:ribosomal protein S11